MAKKNFRTCLPDKKLPSAPAVDHWASICDIWVFVGHHAHTATQLWSHFFPLWEKRIIYDTPASKKWITTTPAFSGERHCLFFDKQFVFHLQRNEILTAFFQPVTDTASRGQLALCSEAAHDGTSTRSERFLLYPAKAKRRPSVSNRFLSTTTTAESKQKHLYIQRGHSYRKTQNSQLQPWQILVVISSSFSGSVGKFAASRQIQGSELAVKFMSCFVCCRIIRWSRGGGTPR